MRVQAVCAALALLFATSGSQAGQPTAEIGQEDAAGKFESFLAKYRSEHQIPSLTAVVLRDGVPVFEKALGWSDDEGDTPATLDTTYSIASVTKPIAAAAIIAEAEAGGLDLAMSMRSDDGWQDTCEWLSGSQIPFGRGGAEADGTPIAPMNCARDITLADMLNMRANGDGSSFVYNPIGFARIDRAILGSGGRALRDIVRERIMQPANIENLALGWRDPEGGSALRLLALPFAVKEGRAVRTALGDDDFRAAAGIKASARHLAQFDRALEQDRLLPEGWYERIFEVPVQSSAGDYRWGWFVQDWEGERLAWHSGWDEGRYSAMYLKLPEQNLTLIVLANTEAIWWENSLARAEIQKSRIASKFLELYVD